MPYSSSSSLLAVLLCHLPASAFSVLFLFHRALCFGRFVATSCLVSINSLSHIALIPRCSLHFFSASSARSQFFLFFPFLPPVPSVCRG
ncbi:hypothetical protein OROHE_008388 [Orobanche hederae]